MERKETKRVNGRSSRGGRPPRKPVTTQQANLLKKLYYKDGVQFGRDKLFHYVRENHPNAKISRRQLYQWLAKQEIHQRTQQRNQTKDKKIAEQKKSGVQLNMDLLDMSVYQRRRAKYLLFVLDDYSRYLRYVILPNKNEPTVAKGLSQLLDDEKLNPKLMKSDNGLEFKNKTMAALMRRRGIKHLFTDPHTPQQNGRVERVNSTIKRALIKQRELGNKWTEVIPKIVSAYNNTRHRVLKTTPAKLDKGANQEDLDKVNNRKKKEAKAKNKLTNKLVVGDKVRTRLIIEATDKSAYVWSEEVQTVTHVRSGNQYKVSGHRKLFTRDRLLKVEAVEGQKPVKRFEVVRIVDERVHRGKRQYLIKWKGYRQPEWNDADLTEEEVPKKVQAFRRSRKSDVRPPSRRRSRR